MKAARMYGPNDVRVVDVPVPAINDHEILIRVRSVGICGTDLRMIRNGASGISAETPRTLGHELSGVIERTGSAVEGLKAGMRVAVAPNIGCGRCGRCARGDAHLCSDYVALGIQLDGGFAEFVRVPEAAVRGGNVAVLPDRVTFEQATLVEPLSCIYNGLLQCPIQLGDDVLVIGAGPIGIMYAQMARRAGAAQVIVANRSADRLDICRAIDDSFVVLGMDRLRADIASLTQGNGVDVCITANPSPETQQLAVELAALNGRINFFGGVPKERERVAINTNLIHYKQLTVTGTTKANNHHFRKTLQFVADGVIDADRLISKRFRLEEADAAFEYAMQSKGIKTLFCFD